jgi:hypothetical protein
MPLQACPWALPLHRFLPERRPAYVFHMLSGLVVFGADTGDFLHGLLVKLNVPVHAVAYRL